MSTRVTGLVCIIALGFADHAIGSPPVKDARVPSTPAERVAATAAVHALEEAPLGSDAEANRKIAMKVLEAPDIQVPVCANLYAAFSAEKSEHHNDLLLQIVLSSMAFMLDHPDRAGDLESVYVAGALGALKSYDKVRAGGPKARSAWFEHLRGLQSSGKLEKMLRAEVAPCLPKTKN